MARKFILKKYGSESEQWFDGPGEVVKAIEEAEGEKFRGKGNLVPVIAKLKVGDSVAPVAGWLVSVEARESEDDDDEETAVGDVPDEPVEVEGDQEDKE